MTTIQPALKYPEISAQGFAHPADRAAQAAIHSVPMLDTVVKKLTEWTYERRLRQLFLGQAVRTGEDQLPALWALQRQAANVLDVEKVPTLYVTQQPVGQAMTVGTHQPVTLVMSGLATGYDEDEQRAVLGHEMGHVLADHVGLTSSLQLVQMLLNGVMRGQALAQIPLRGVYYALLEWSRAAELTADRAGLLVADDPLVPCRTLMRIAGGPVKDMNLDAFIRQATEYHEEGDPFARWSRFGAEIGATHPFPVRRVRELIGWVTAGEFDRIRAGNYVRRGQEPPPSAEFDHAFAHYRRRFSSVVDRAGAGVAQVVDKITGWLDGRERGGSGSAEEDDGIGEEI